MSCQMRIHRHWYQPLGRYLLGLEALYAHGFQRSLKWSVDCPGVAPDDREYALAIARRYQAKAARGRSTAPARAAAAKPKAAAQTSGTNLDTVGAAPPAIAQESTGQGSSPSGGW